MGKVTILCISPFTEEFEKVCDRYEDRKCCMCYRPSVAVPISKVEEMVKLLETSGSNTKNQVKEILKEYLPK